MCGRAFARSCGRTAGYEGIFFPFRAKVSTHFGPKIGYLIRRSIGHTVGKRRSFGLTVGHPWEHWACPAPSKPMLAHFRSNTASLPAMWTHTKVPKVTFLEEGNRRGARPGVSRPSRGARRVLISGASSPGPQLDAPLIRTPIGQKREAGDPKASRGAARHRPASRSGRGRPRAAQKV